MSDPLTLPSAEVLADHSLPFRFSGLSSDEAPPRPPRRPRRRALTWTLSLVGAVLLAGGFTLLQLGASQGFDDAQGSLDRATTQQDAAVQQVRAALSRSDSTTKTVGAVLATQSDDLISAADRTGLTTADDAAVQAAHTATGLIPSGPVAKRAKPFWFWEADSAADRLRADASAARRSTTSLDSAGKKIDETLTAVQASGSAAITAAADRAAGAEAANVPATNESVLSLRTMVTQVKSLASPLQEQLTTTFPALVLAVHKVQASHAATLDAESGPLEDSRLQLEAFARSLAPGVLIDFEWSDLVNGLGGPNGYLSGETAWWYDQGGYATIRLSNSIAESWPSDSAHAIVAHEVGHAITVRCRTMYDTTNDQTAEAWATAWAISMGYTNEANGTSAYGAPPESLIQTAAGCR
ncbi:hypothetical protein [Microbacterium panaciterrae]|uniref:Uncharacterized protein n=1 Tax=Microbacterium panaciterrae TaxID=985759 RepID=A0ABP8PMH6_9MICO